jgi:hypothetical protein
LVPARIFLTDIDVKIAEEVEALSQTIFSPDKYLQILLFKVVNTTMQKYCSNPLFIFNQAEQLK